MKRFLGGLSPNKPPPPPRIPTVCFRRFICQHTAAAGTGTVPEEPEPF